MGTVTLLEVPFRVFPHPEPRVVSMVRPSSVDRGRISRNGIADLPSEFALLPAAKESGFPHPAQSSRLALVSRRRNMSPFFRRSIPAHGVAFTRRTPLVRLAQAPCEPGASAAQFRPTYLCDGTLADARFSPQDIDLVGLFPGKIGQFASEVPIARCIFVDRAEQIQCLDDSLGGQIEYIVDQGGEIFVSSVPVPWVSTSTDTG